MLKNILIYLPFFVRLFYKTPKHKFSTFIWNNKILDRIGIFSAMVIRKMFTYKPAWRSPFILSPLSSHIYSNQVYFIADTLMLLFLFRHYCKWYLYNDWFFFKLRVHSLLYSFLTNCEFIRSIFMICFGYIVRCGDSFIPSNFWRKRTSIIHPRQCTRTRSMCALHPELYRFVCFRLIILYCTSRHYH